MALPYRIGVSSLGHVLVADGGDGLCAVLLGDDPALLLAELGERFAGEAFAPAETLQGVLSAVVAFIEEPTHVCTLQLAPRGTAFQQRIWAALRAIPPGMTTTYSALTAALDLSPTAVRAVAGACGANPLAVVVPCHRVVRQDGGLAGYRWGLERKRRLLEREAGGFGQLSLL